MQLFSHLQYLCKLREEITRHQYRKITCTTFTLSARGWNSTANLQQRVKIGIHVLINIIIFLQNRTVLFSLLIHFVLNQSTKKVDLLSLRGWMWEWMWGCECTCHTHLPNRPERFAELKWIVQDSGKQYIMLYIFLSSTSQVKLQ